MGGIFGEFFELPYTRIKHYNFDRSAKVLAVFSNLNNTDIAEQRINNAVFSLQ